MFYLQKEISTKLGIGKAGLCGKITLENIVPAY